MYLIMVSFIIAIPRTF